tara:strand:- start:2973 stop:4712 length:1740 start_codon:yes stop_codon:yes gene_type:complete
LYKNLKNIVSILNTEKKVKSLILALIILGGIFLEVICIFSIYEIVRETTSLMVPDEQLNNNKYLELIFSYLSINYNLTNLVTLSVLLYFMKFFYILIVNYLQFKFINSVRVDLNIILFKKYLSKNYIYFLNNNPSKLIRNIETEVGQFILGCLLQIIILLTEISLLIILVISLAFINLEIVILLLTVFIVSISVYFLLIKKILLSEGEKRIRFSEKILKNLNESLHGIKNIKIFNAGKYFVSEVETNAKGLAKTNIIFSVFSQIPKNALEIIAVTLVAIMIYSKNVMGTFEIETFSTLSFFVLAAFKILPSISKIILSFQNLKFSEPSVEILKKEIKKTNTKKINKNSKENPVKFENYISLNNVSFKYDYQAEYLFKNVNLKIFKNDIIGIFGESGSGKSTLIDIIIGLLKPTEGNIKVDGEKISDQNRESWINCVGYVPQKIFLTDDTLYENVAFGKNKDQINKTKVIESLKSVELHKFLNLTNLRRKLGQSGNNVSGGQLQRIGIARSLYKQSEIYIFDESTSALDDQAEKKMINLIKKISKKKPVIIVSHNLSNLKICNKVFCLKDKNLSSIKKIF